MSPDDPDLDLDSPMRSVTVSFSITGWQNINDARCLVCDRLIRVNMSRHLRLSHTTCQCFWRCPVPSCPTWFASELYGKDHLEQIHNFSEGRGYSFYECLRRIGVVWPEFLLRPEEYDRSGSMDGSSACTEDRPGTPSDGTGRARPVARSSSRGAVSSVSIACTDLLSHVEPLPIDQLLLHDTQTVCSWPDNARSELFAVARRDIAVARPNMTSLTRYVDMHDAHLAGPMVD